MTDDINKIRAMEKDILYNGDRGGLYVPSNCRDYGIKSITRQQRTNKKVDYTTKYIDHITGMEKEYCGSI